MGTRKASAGGLPRTVKKARTPTKNRFAVEDEERVDNRRGDKTMMNLKVDFEKIQKLDGPTSENGCGTCGMEDAGNNQKGVNCEIRSCWYHSACAGVKPRIHERPQEADICLMRCLMRHYRVLLCPVYTENFHHKSSVYFRLRERWYARCSSDRLQQTYILYICQ